MPDHFTSFSKRITHMGVSRHRQSIFAALNAELSELDGDLLDVGCGKMPYRQYILDHSKVSVYRGIDIETAINYDETVQPDLRWDGQMMPIDDNQYDCAIATEVLEHCFEPEVTLREIFRVLKPGGKLFFTVPFVWNLHEVPYDAYRYTPFAMEYLLRHGGFSDVKIGHLGGGHAALGQMIALWCRRAAIRVPFRTPLSLLLWPICEFLYWLDGPLKPKGDPLNYREGQMLTGLYGTCCKPLSKTTVLQ